MPSVSNVNFVVMQGDAAREAQNIRNLAQDSNQVVVAQHQEKKDEVKKATIQTSEGSNEIKFKKDKEKEKKRKTKKTYRKRLTERTIVPATKMFLFNKKKRILDILA
ncbi:conserved hypothetical protein [Candidatus Magnetomoraceae bacterium gMMP-15]